MTKKLYYILLTIAFGVISIPTLFNVIFQERILIGVINKTLIKLLLVLFICIVEVHFMKCTLSKVIGYVLWVVLVIGILFKIQHWPFGYEIFSMAGLLILVNLIIAASIDKNKGFFHYLLFVFILERFIMILTPTNEFHWWIDVLICLAITIVGIGKILNLKHLKS
ncbi:hypothetical protein [Kordia sp.]|uniref:hypothetical protein n=1 Tax=Kordia sp. TaxID=1965332 RepID=UPI003D2B6DCA